MNPLAKGIALVFLCGLLYFGWVYMKTQSNSGGAPASLNALFSLWATRYSVDPLAVQTVYHMENQKNEAAAQSGGQWPIGDEGTSFGPMQIHKGGLDPNGNDNGPGAIDDWEAANGNIDQSGDYTYLAAWGNSLAVEIGVWNLMRCIDAAPGAIDLAFTKYNAGLGASVVSQSYGVPALAFYQSIGGTAPAQSQPANPLVSEADTSDGSEAPS